MATKRVAAKYVISAEDKTKGAFRSIKKSLKSVGGAVLNFKSALLSAGTAGILGKQLLDVSKSFEILQASLVTVTGSAAAADVAFERVRKFAAQTPFSIEQVTEAFIKLKAFGLDPSEESLRSFGNTASAMGKTLKQFTEAVADAVTLEFERLKEFGILSRQVGNNVVFTFKGMKTTIKRDAKAIEKFLVDLGKTEFAGGMERQSKTIGGALSNLGDAWDTMLFKFGQTGPIQTATAAIKELTNALNDLIPVEIPIEFDLARLKIDREKIKEAISFGEFAKQGGTLLAGQGKRAMDALQDQLIAINKEIDTLESRRIGRIKLQFQEMEEAFKKALTPAAKTMVRDILGGVDRASLKETKKFIAEAERELNRELARENKLLIEGESLRTRMLTPLEMYHKQLEDINRLLDANVISQQTSNRAILDAAREFDEATVIMKEGVEELDIVGEELGYTFSSAFEEAAVSGENLRDVIRGLVQDIQRIILRRTISEPLGGLVSSLIPSFSFGGGGGATGGAASVASVFASAFPGRAGGGPAPAGHAFVVGEEGPEILQMGSTGGRVIPNNAMGGGDVITNVTVNADGGVGTDGAGKPGELGRILGNLVATEIQRQKRPGGLLA